MAREFSKAFYKSAAWQSCRASYIRSKGGLCEDCLQRGIITTGAEVHHIVELTPDNIGNPAVTLAWSNLRLLCHDCHMKRHAGAQQKRYRVDQITGAVVMDPPPGLTRAAYTREIGRAHV